MKHKIISFVVALLPLLSLNVALAQPVNSTNSSPKPKQSIAVTAYSRIAPFVNPETFFVARVDLDTLDSNAFLQTIDDIFVGFLKEQGFDRKNILGVNRDFRRALDELKSEIDALIAFKSTFKVREIFVLIQNQNDEHFRVFVPFSSANRDAAKEALSGLLSDGDASFAFVNAPGGLVITNNATLDESKYANLEIRPNAALQKFFERTAGSTVQIYISYLKLEKLYKTGLGLCKRPTARVLSDLPTAAQKSFEVFDSFAQETTLTFDVNSLALKGEMVFITSAHAKEFRNGLEEFVNLKIDEFFDSNVEETRALFPEVSDEDFEKYNLLNLSREIARASSLKLIPTQSGSALTFEITPQTKDLLHNSCFWQILFIPLVISQANDQ